MSDISVEYVADHAALERIIGQVSSDALNFVGRAVTDRARAHAPGPGRQLPGTTYRATGRLRSSIGMSLDLRARSLTVYAGTSYAHFVHNGTRWMPARPFLLQAMREVRL